jgi:hypothetical protein
MFGTVIKKFRVFSNLVDRIFNNTDELKELMKKTFSRPHPYPPFLSKERGSS